MEEMKTCPYCGKQIKLEAKKCKYCGEWLQEQQDNRALQKNCPYCGEVIEATSESCPYCKENLKHEKAEVRNAENDGKENRKMKNTLSDKTEDNITVVAEKEKPGFFEYYLYNVFIKHFADFKGQISRKQYWIGTLLFYGLFFICMFLAISTQLDILFLLPSLVCWGGIVPYIAMDVRRLRDCGISGLWILLFLLTPLMLWAMFSKGETKAIPVKWQKVDSFVGGIIGLILVIGIISTCSGNARYNEEVMSTTIELSEDNPYNLPNTAIEEDEQKK